MSYILVVDDLEPMRKLMARMLASTGMEVVTADDGAEALARVAERRPTLILLDLHLPEVDGWEVLRQLQSNAADAMIPVVLVSGDPRVRPHHPTAGLGAQGVLHKPFTSEQLLGTVKGILG